MTVLLVSVSVEGLKAETLSPTRETKLSGIQGPDVNIRHIICQFRRIETVNNVKLVCQLFS
jgi:hypothetical protein